MSSRAVVLALGLGAFACYDDGHHPHHDYGPATDCDPAVLAAGIDRGGYLDLSPGLGAGATVEYAGDGFWRIATTCDTEYPPHYECVWDIEVTPFDSPLIAVSPEGLESSDSLSLFSPASGVETVSFVSVTTTEIDAFTLETTPGAPLEIDAILDGGCGGPFVSWIDDGFLSNSPTRVMDLYPHDP